MKNFIFDLGPHTQVHCLVKADPACKVIHVLDFHGPSAVVHFIRQIQGRIFRHKQLAGSVAEWKWLLYGTDAEVMEYDSSRPVYESGFIPVNSNHPHYRLLDQDFLQRMRSLYEIGYYAARQ